MGSSATPFHRIFAHGVDSRDPFSAGRIIFMIMTQGKTNAARRERIDEAAAGQRIDNYLLRTANGVPKSHVYRILRGGEVRVNGRRVRQTYRLVPGDEVRIPPLRVGEMPAELSVPAGKPLPVAR